DHQHRCSALALGELELDQLWVLGIIVPGPGEHEPLGRIDHGVGTDRAILGSVGGVAHDETDRSADAKVDLCRGGLPVRARVEPATHHLRAGPGLEHALDGGVEGTLDSQLSLTVVCHPVSSRYSPTTSNRLS